MQDFDGHELELMLNGRPGVLVDDIRRHAQFTGGYAVSLGGARIMAQRDCSAHCSLSNSTILNRCCYYGRLLSK